MISTVPRKMIKHFEFLTLFLCKIKSWDGRWTFYRRIYNARRGLSIMSSNKITRRRDVSTLQAPLLALLLSLTRLLTTSKPPNIKLDTNFSIKMSLREHIHMTSDFWLGRHVKLHLMISDVGRSDLPFLNFCFFHLFLLD